MANLRIKQANAADIRTIKVSFTADLRPDLVTGNVTVQSLAAGVPDVQVTQISVREDILVITTLPQTPYSKYKVVFVSTPQVRFKSADGTSYLIEDGRSNAIDIIGAEDPDNLIRDNLVVYLKDNIYNLDRGTMIRTILDNISTNMMMAMHDTYQSKNDNYLSFSVTDEMKTRGYGPWDRLGEESAYEITRVATTPTDATIAGSISFTSFPSEIITLQREVVAAETLIASAQEAIAGTFNRLTLTVRHSPVTKLVSVRINYQDGYVFNYDIRTYGYQIQNPRYDTQYGATLLTLGENQIQLNEQIFEDSNFEIPGAGDIVTVSYEYKSLGKVINPDSVTVTKVLDATREAVGPLYTEFTLKFHPVVTSTGDVATNNGVLWQDPASATPFLTTHPAFLVELPYSLASVPSYPGEFSIDYNTGVVAVYGADSTHDGTGNYPPAASYKYLKTFVPTLDYTYNPDTYELVASPLRDLPTQVAKISFEYEQVLVPGIDYNTGVHTEVIDERIDNRLLSSTSLRAENYPVTNVFRIFNETTNEVYQLGRFSGNTIHFSSIKPPNITNTTRERANFTDQFNEVLISMQELTNVYGVRIFKFKLLYQNIIAATEDVIASDYNTSMSFSRSDIFEDELYYDGQILSVIQNINRLRVGKYQVDYRNGIVYVGVSSTQNLDVGTVSYKIPVIDPLNPHVIAVSDIYHSLGPNLGVAKHLDYSGFDDGEITPTTASLEFSDERFMNGDVTAPYVVVSDTITVTDDIKIVRHVFDGYDLNNNDNPVDFGPTATSSANIIYLDSDGVEKIEYSLVVGAGLTVNVTAISPGIEIGRAISVVRISDGYQLLDGYATVLGNTITLSATGGGVVGDIVNVIYTVVLNGAATPIVDYDRGEYFVDYTYLADEILVSYEYGDNVVDYRESTTIGAGQTYYTSYKVGALRDALLANFGSLIDIPELQSFDVNLDREIYRDALMGALQSFTKGPTVPAMKELVSNITKIEPEIVEAIFNAWSLGVSRLYPCPFAVEGTPQLVAGKFDQGLLCTKVEDAVSFPVSSNLKLDEGSLETWIIPEWDGLDNDATLTFSGLTRDGYAIPASNIYIGSLSYHPTITNGAFTLNRNDTVDPSGLPSALFVNTGVFIYYDIDVKRWKVIAKDFPKDGYDGYIYAGQIVSSGDVYDVKFIPGFSEASDVLRSGTSQIQFEMYLDGYEVIWDGYVHALDGFSFMADDRHYVFDFAETESKNRFSLYKDGRGYLNFEVWDQGGRYNQKKDRKNVYKVSADIQSWSAGEKHHIATSWKMNTSDRRDELHLFIDGFEVPNIMRYGGVPSASATDRFRTVKPEVVVGTVPLNTVVGNDLITTMGSDIVTSTTIDFGLAGINPGDTIRIRETGFSTYIINSVSGDTLVLNSLMPSTMAGARFSVNEFSAVVSTQIDLFSNIAVYSLIGTTETELPGLRAEIPAYEISKNVDNENVLTILGDVAAGATILIRTLGLNFRRCLERVYLWNDTNTVLKTQLPPPINLDEVSIRAVVLPYIVIGPDNATIDAFGNFVANFSAADGYVTQTTNTLEGRTLSVRVTGGNVDFTTPTVITINGTSTGPVSESISFTAPGDGYTQYKWKTITSIDGYTKPRDPSLDGLAVEIKELYSVTVDDGNNAYAYIRFAYQTQSGVSLQGTGSDIVTDLLGYFPASEVGNLMVIDSPLAVAGTYQIIERIDNLNVRLDRVVGSAFTNGRYKDYNISLGRSGFQNGFFYLQTAGGATANPYPVPQGVYEFDYSAYLEIPFDPVDQTAYIGNDFTMSYPAKAVLDEFRIRSQQLTDTRVGETIALNEQSVTTDYQALRPFTKDAVTLVLLHFEESPPINDADYYIAANREYIQSSSSVNSRFGQSIVILERGLIFENKGCLTKQAGTIEFMVSPRFDTYNDPLPRFYFDASAAIAESVTSLTRGMVKVSGSIGQVLSVRLATDTTNTGTDYFAGGSIAADRKTINLHQALPYQRTPVKVTYVPSGLKGDRISIYKDEAGYITFNVRANGFDYQTRQPVFWSRDTWHRVRATYKFNSADNQDEIRLFVDGEERGIIRFGQGLIFGQGFIFGQMAAGVNNQRLIDDINFVDPITQFFVGMDYVGVHGAQARIDNLRLSDINRGPLSILGQDKDVNYNTNLDLVYPVIEDVYTTFLLDFGQVVQKTTDFAILRNPQYGIFNFDLNIIDSFDIVLSSERVQKILESMILALKPANSQVHISYLR